MWQTLVRDKSTADHDVTGGELGTVDGDRIETVQCLRRGNLAELEPTAVGWS